MDVIESPPGRSRSRPVVMLLALSVVIGLAVWALERGSEKPPSAAPAGPSPGQSGTPGGFLPRFPKGQPPPSSLAALVAPMKPPRVVAPALGTVAGIDGIPVLPQGVYTVTELSGGFLVTSRPAYSGVGPQPPADGFLVSGDLRTPRLLVTAGIVAAGADGRSVLAATGPEVTRVGLDGTRRQEGTLPPERTLVLDTIAGYLVAATPAGPWEIWDPTSGQVRHRIPQLFAAGGGSIAYGSFSRAITVVDLSTGTELETEIPDRELTVHQAVFSRDGRYLATHLINRGQWQHLIAVLDIKLALWYAMPGTPFAALNQLALAWSGHTLVLAYTTDQPAVALWTPGDETVYSIPVP